MTTSIFENTKDLMLGGIAITSVTQDQLNAHLESALIAQRQTSLFFANTNFIVKCQPLLAQIDNGNCVIVNDGVGVDIATWLVHKKRFPENLNGTDFIPQFLAHVRHQGRVFLLGGKPGIANSAAKTLAALYDVNVVGIADGYDEAKNNQQLIQRINESNANIILVAMGNPMQEAWILNNQAQLNVSIYLGVGALLDFLAGDKPRAPNIVQKLRLEWLYRLCLEPKRLAKRYTLDIFVFLRLCFHYQKQQQN
jgi:beta-1,4-glucosyltransferase